MESISMEKKKNTFEAFPENMERWTRVVLHGKLFRDGWKRQRWKTAYVKSPAARMTIMKTAN